MNISILQEDLSNNVLLASRFVSTKAQLPVLGNILLKAKEGKLSLSATNLETGISISIGAKIEEEGSITIPAKILVDIITHLPAGKVQLTVNKDQLAVLCNSFSASLSGIPASEFPHVPDSIDEKTFSFGKEMLSLLTKQVTYAAAVDDIRPILTGICLLVERNKVIAVATDGVRMSYKEIEGSLLKINKSTEENKTSKFLLPARIIEELNKALGTKSEEIGILVKEKEGQVLFSSESIVVTGRLIDGEFPDFNRVLPKEYTTRVEMGKGELIQAVKAASVFARESASIVKLKISSNGLILFAESNQYGKEEIGVEAKVEGEETTIAFNYRYILDFLSSVSGEVISIETQGPTTPGVFKDTHDESYKHIIMPVRIQQ